jgi:Mor family transcriptional regulator
MTDNIIEQIKSAANQGALNFGHSPQIASDLADYIAHKIMKSIGGAPFYIPKNDIYQRNQQIKAEFNGKNKADLLKKYAVSKSTLHRILKNQGEK